MKKFFFLVGVGLIPLLAGCSSTSVTLAPVGPNPASGESMASTGALQVYSSVVKEHDDQNQAGDGMSGWYQHTDYSIYNLQGNLVRHVGNATGHYTQTPARIALPAGKYLVKAQAKDYLRVEVPVTIERGRTTRIHLDENWKPLSDAPKSELVTLPDGNPVGWRAKSSREMGIN